MARPAFLDELNISKKKEPVEKPTRLLDTYGIPITQKQQQKNLASSSSEVKSKANHKSYDLPNSDLHQRIRVCVRKRPLSRKEKIAKESDIADVVGNRTLHINAPRTKIDLTRVTEQYPFIFDEVFDSGVTNEQIYKRTAQPLVEYMFNGGKATCFAHGQTGSGKTYTMLDPNHGLYFRAAQDVFRLLSQHRYSHLNVYVAFYEIYQNQIYDLLNDRNRLLARSDANNDVTITGLKYYRVKVVDNLIKIFEVGNEARMTGQTGANTNSSRSHAILQILLKDKEQVDYGKLSFIDLAGSERGADRGESDAKTRMEGAEINKSLLALKECIRALDQEQRHTPFRGSKLTQVLRDSFIGDSRTCMIATISPNFANSDHTLNTLRYADRMKQLRS
ncbi:kinesin-domain-containing protein, partial [Backusella circina FSU 941]